MAQRESLKDEIQSALKGKPTSGFDDSDTEITDLVLDLEAGNSGHVEDEEDQEEKQGELCQIIQKSYKTKMYFYFAKSF